MVLLENIVFKIGSKVINEVYNLHSAGFLTEEIIFLTG